MSRFDYNAPLRARIQNLEAQRNLAVIQLLDKQKQLAAAEKERDELRAALAETTKVMQRLYKWLGTELSTKFPAADIEAWLAKYGRV